MAVSTGFAVTDADQMLISTKPSSGVAESIDVGLNKHAFSKWKAKGCNPDQIAAKMNDRLGKNALDDCCGYRLL
ncbi:hypothetical protein PHMEG_00040488 [Phytophthora megakarya]|uniref:Uncharacterized protein n=1 Tax=Phytophthora megakarya TaxID=4795 RepID=A0A225UDG4_9STRA|nr:hypothetical protein PHMEG_00040488 [Phytophthora megakarya]